MKQYNWKLYSGFVKYISCPLIFKRDGLKNFNNNLNQLEKSQYWSRDKLSDFQFKALKKLLSHAFENTKFYREIFEEAGFNPSTMKDPTEIKKIPTLSKKDIRDNVDSLLAYNYDKDDIHSAETGGTTGVKMKFYRDNACLSPKEAALYRYEKWTGWDFGEKSGIVWTAQQDYVGHWTFKSKLKNALSLRQLVLPAAIMDDASIADYVNRLIIKRPTMIRAFVSPIYEVAKYIKYKGIDNIKLKGIITTGEPLYRHQREVIAEAFNCDVFDSYRSREAGPIAQECECHNGMHINAESLYIEIVPQSGANSLVGGIGEIVVTDLLNYGMPLIRYRMGDVGMLSEENCSCGRGLPLLKNIAGRTADILYTPDKKRITAGSLVLYLVDEAPGLLGQVQIIQDKLDHLIIRMTNDPPPSKEIVDYQKKTIKRLFGAQMGVSFEQVNEIPLERSGKYMFTICQIPESER